MTKYTTTTLPMPYSVALAYSCFVQMADGEKGSFLNLVHSQLAPLDRVFNDLSKAGINVDGCSDIDVYIKHYEMLANPAPETCECELCQGTGMDSRDPRRPCDHCDGEGTVAL